MESNVLAKLNYTKMLMLRELYAIMKNIYSQQILLKY